MYFTCGTSGISSIGAQHLFMFSSYHRRQSAPSSRGGLAQEQGRQGCRPTSPAGPSPQTVRSSKCLSTSVFLKIGLKIELGNSLCLLFIGLSACNAPSDSSSFPAQQSSYYCCSACYFLSYCWRLAVGAFSALHRERRFLSLGLPSQI